MKKFCWSAPWGPNFWSSLGQLVSQGFARSSIFTGWDWPEQTRVRVYSCSVSLKKTESWTSLLLLSPNFKSFHRGRIMTRPLVSSGFCSWINCYWTELTRTNQSCVAVGSVQDRVFSEVFATTLEGPWN
jgi:hypothetical protein